MARLSQISEEAVNKFLSETYEQSGVVPSLAEIRRKFGGGNWARLKEIVERWKKAALKGGVNEMFEDLKTPEEQERLFNYMTAFYEDRIRSVLSERKDAIEQELAKALGDRDLVIEENLRLASELAAIKEESAEKESVWLKQREEINSEMQKLNDAFAVRLASLTEKNALLLGEMKAQNDLAKKEAEEWKLKYMTLLESARTPIARQEVN